MWVTSLDSAPTLGKTQVQEEWGQGEGHLTFDEF